ncbi:ABC transporter permease subunit [Neobacillus sp. NPDC093127]|uniref:ABC transporter permease subunit n=1 Tax=Neobacillus sp. NPDC093127 TaxID=3364296 RepID=UPI0038175DDE
MLRLLKFELYKIYKQKSIYILFALLIALISTGGWIDRSNEKVIYQGYQKWEGKLTAEKIYKLDRIREDGNKKSDAGQEFTFKEHLLYSISMVIFQQTNFTDERNKEIAQLTEKIQQTPLSYEKRQAELKKDMLSRIDTSYFYYPKGPAIMLDMIYTFGFVITAFMTIIGIGPIFSKEYSSGMDQFLLSSKYGRSKAVTAKILASLMFILSVIAVWSLYSVARSAYSFGLHGWKSSIQSVIQFLESPYPFSLSSAFTMMMAIHVVAALAFGLIVVFISAVSKKVIVSVLASGVIFGLPLALDTVLDYGGTKKVWVDRFISFSIYQFMKVKELFVGFRTYNFFGYPVLQPILAIVLSIFTIIIFWYMTKWILKKKQITV